jgi:hypothetical protein
MDDDRSQSAAVLEANREYLAKYKVGMNFQYKLPNGQIVFGVLERFGLNCFGEVVLGLREIVPTANDMVGIYFVHPTNLLLLQLSQ